MVAIKLRQLGAEVANPIGLVYEMPPAEFAYFFTRARKIRYCRRRCCFISTLIRRELQLVDYSKTILGCFILLSSNILLQLKLMWCSYALSRSNNAKQLCVGYCANLLLKYFDFHVPNGHT